jgi:imidazolonepropionase-like amidohydrolase
MRGTLEKRLARAEEKRETRQEGAEQHDYPYRAETCNPDRRHRPCTAEECVLVIRGRHIDFVGDAAQWQAEEHEHLTTLDLSGRFVLPGLIDCHVHLAMDGPPDSRLTGEWAWTTLLMLKHAQNSLAAGITTVRDVGGRHGLEFSVRRSIEEGLWVGPRMQLAGKLLSITSAGADYYDGMYREADGVDEVRKAAREQLKAGADLLKVLATGAVLTPDEQPGAVQFGLDELRAAVEEARKVGKGVAAHAHALEGIRNAVAAGVRTIEHGPICIRIANCSPPWPNAAFFWYPR